MPSLPAVRILKNRLVFDGLIETRPGGGAPDDSEYCEDPEVEPFKRQYTTFLHADAVERRRPQPVRRSPRRAAAPRSFVNGSRRSLPDAAGGATGRLRKVPFEPSTSADPRYEPDDSPTGRPSTLKVPFEPTAPTSTTRTSGRAGQACNRGWGSPVGRAEPARLQERPFKKGSREPIGCPANSKIGASRSTRRRARRDPDRQRLPRRADQP